MRAVIEIGKQKFGLTHGRLVNNSEYADVSIHMVVGGKKEVVFAHEVFLRRRKVSGLLFESSVSALCSKIEKKNGYTNAYVAEEAHVFCNPQILVTLLRYVYLSDTGAIEMSEDLPFLVNLLATASAAGLGDSFLACVIENRVLALTNDATAHLLVARSSEYGLDRLHDKVRRFAFANWSRFISDKDGCRRLGMELLSQLSAANAKGDQQNLAGGDSHSFSNPESEDSLISDLQQMYASLKNENIGDVAIECDKNVLLGAHKAVLAGFNDGLRGELASATLMSPKKKVSTRLELRLSSDQGRETLKSRTACEALLRFIYFGEISMEQSDAVELIRCLSDYQMISLEASCEASIQQPCSIESCFPILGVTFHPSWVSRASMGPLRNSVTSFIVSHFRELDLNGWSGLPPELFHALLAVQRSVPISNPESPEVEKNDLPTKSILPKSSPRPEFPPPPPPQLPAKPVTFEAESTDSGHSEEDVADSEEE